MDPSAQLVLSKATDQRRALRENRRPIVGEQPEPSMPMTSNNIQSSGGGDRNALKVPVSSDGLREWSFGLFDCFSDRPTFALSMCCCCYVYSRNKQRLDHLERHGVPLRKEVKRRNHDCKVFALLQCCLSAGWGLQAISRSDLRRRYGIRGDAVDDVLTTGCCLPCELVRTHREIQLEESSFH